MNSLVAPLSGSLLFALLVVVGIRRKRAQFDLVDYLILVSVVGPVFLFSVLSVWATIFGLCLLLLIGLLVEYFLRFLLKSSKQQYATEPRLNFWSESIETARLASGNYPDDYMSTEFFDQMLRRDELELKLRAVKMWQSTNKEFENQQFRSTELNVIDGRRVTTNVPSRVRQNIYLMGGSTVFCSEVPDRYTVPSFLQRLVNAVDDSISVSNHGQRGATTANRLRYFESLDGISRDDIAIFLFGDNDCGTYLDQKRHPLTRIVVVVERLSKYGFEIFKWLYGEIAPRFWRNRSHSSVKKLIQQFEKTAQLCQKRGVKLLCVLQPNIFTLVSQLEYDLRLRHSSSTEISVSVNDAYPKYVHWLRDKDFAVSAADIFNRSPDHVYLDWAHLNARGNEKLANFLFDELERRNLIKQDLGL
jgi:lysophospholipase L1-like esterase